MALIINIETATAVCSAALGRDGEVIAFRETTEPNSHSLMLGTFIKEVLEEAGITSAELDAVAVSSGPGSYTGLRIGVSMAKGLAYSLDIPLIAVPTLKAMANGIRQDYGDARFLIPMIDARRMEVYAAVFSSALNEVEAVKPVVIDGDSFGDYLQKGKTVFFGDGAAKCKTVIHSENAVFAVGGFPSARSMAPLSNEMFLHNNFEDTAYFEPFYLKEFQAKISKIKGLR
jgi:tRNA threonylcarbamoyladenosine biosynthesis protein TsaB